MGVYSSIASLVIVSPYLEAKEYFGKCPVFQEDKLLMFVDHSHHTCLVRKCH